MTTEKKIHYALYPRDENGDDYIYETDGIHDVTRAIEFAIRECEEHGASEVTVIAEDPEDYDPATGQMAEGTEIAYIIAPIAEPSLTDGISVGYTWRDMARMSLFGLDDAARWKGEDKDKMIDDVLSEIIERQNESQDRIIVSDVPIITIPRWKRLDNMEEGQAIRSVPGVKLIGHRLSQEDPIVITESDLRWLLEQVYDEEMDGERYVEIKDEHAEEVATGISYTISIDNLDDYATVEWEDGARQIIVLNRGDADLIRNGADPVRDGWEDGAGNLVCYENADTVEIKEMKEGERMRSEISFPSRIKVRGNSYCIPIQKSWVESMGLEPGDEVDVRIAIPAETE